MLKVQNLALSYGAIRALHDVSLEVKQGEIVTLLGSNGAGKTTTLRAISSLVPTLKGEIVFESHNLTKSKLKAHDIVKLGIAHSPEGRKIFGNLSVEENLKMGCYIRDEKKEAAEIEKDLEEVFLLFPRLKERLSQLGGTLSGGEQQMLAISRALMQRPKLLMLDEPSLGIAPVLVATIFKALVEINKRGTTILLVEQNASAALKIAHRAYILETGRTTLSGNAADIAANPKIKEAYLGGH